MRKERRITINIIKINNINNIRLSEFFARKYIEKKEIALK